VTGKDGVKCPSIHQIDDGVIFIFVIELPKPRLLLVVLGRTEVTFVLGGPKSPGHDPTCGLYVRRTEVTKDRVNISVLGGPKSPGHDPTCGLYVRRTEVTKDRVNISFCHRFTL